MNKCTKLRNLYSVSNTFENDEILSLKSLHGVISINDTYEFNGSCLLYDLFRNNRLEYVNIFNKEPNTNVIISGFISKNI